MSADQSEASIYTGNLQGLGPLEAEVMSVLWPKGQATVADVAAVINEARPVAYTTIMTIMTRLVTKGLLRRRLSGKAYVYEPAKTLEEFRAELAREGVRALIRDFGDLAVANFVEEIETADPDRLRRLDEFLERRAKQ